MKERSELVRIGCEIQAQIGADEFIDELLHWIPESELEDALDMINGIYDLGYEIKTS